MLQAPNGFIYIVAAFLAMIGILATFPTPLSVPDLDPDYAIWFVFLAWFMLAAATMRPSGAKSKAQAAPAAPKTHAAPEPVHHAAPAAAVHHAEPVHHDEPAPAVHHAAPAIHQEEHEDMHDPMAKAVPHPAH